MCAYGTYNSEDAGGDLPLNGAKAPCNPRALQACAANASCAAEPQGVAAITQCTVEPTAASPCLPTHYNLRRLVNRIGGYEEPRYVAIASGHSGGVIYVAMDHAIFAVSTFQGLEGIGQSFDGAGMALIAGLVS